MVPSPPSEPPTADAGEDLYGLDELLAVAGERLGEEITPRTVRLYATQGLIDRPGRSGRHAVYGHRHLLQLLLIRSLARRGLSLSAIAPLCALPDAELERQLGELADSEPASEERQRLRKPALDYLQSLRSAQGKGAVRPAASSDSALHLSLPSPSEDLFLEVHEEAEADRTPAETSRSLLSLLGSPLFHRSRTPAPSSPARREATSRWHRFTLMPGVELHISDTVVVPPAGSRRHQWLRKLADRLIALLDAEDG